MYYKLNPCLLFVALLLTAVTGIRAQGYSIFASTPISFQVGTTYVPGTTALNLWGGAFVVDANGVVSGSGTLTSFANRQIRSTKTPFTILNGSRATSIQTTTSTSTNTNTYGTPLHLTTDVYSATTTTSTADFYATARIGSGRIPPTAQFKGIITAENTVSTNTSITVYQYYNGYENTANYSTNITCQTNSWEYIDGAIFGPSSQAGDFSAGGSTSSRTEGPPIN